jgi:hypothetical protein
MYARLLFSALPPGFKTVLDFLNAEWGGGGLYWVCFSLLFVCLSLYSVSQHYTAFQINSCTLAGRTQTSNIFGLICPKHYIRALIAN